MITFQPRVVRTECQTVRDKVQRHVNDAEKHGAAAVLIAGASPNRPGFFFEPTEV